MQQLLVFQVLEYSALQALLLAPVPVFRQALLLVLQCLLLYLQVLQLLELQLV